ncbi:MAG: peroxiredoxin [Gammaproteobacteria bacterium]|nr:peroxiredoxin [Rhodocyclaceae bacterium]MBU3909110.1 peroxiredoxin [Gammaproteobacteria bacterium]MBU3988116.1 peroxiredoxin [Gammaproteobacteria bacterium]MBU4003321.1 peroxiredoxin [Gammaproteobacteria bacterium]MBU4022153.1 peroxiredoxin [Gammaproteobacteria bacterium]
MSNPSTPSAVGLEVPDFSLPATAGKTFTLSAQRGSPLVVYFYPKDSTPGCTTEAQQFRDLHAEFVKAGGSVWGVSRDSIKSHENFKSVLGLPFELLCDADETACILFDVIKMKNMYGKLVKGIERSTFLIDRNGKLAREWRAVKADGHAAEVLTALQAL